MVHKNNFVAVLRVNNQILREDKDGDTQIVTLPFGSEFDIVLKNLNSRRAVVTISLDGKSVIDDLIVNANSESVIERFLEGNMTSGHRFKFIQKTKEISVHRGDKIDDGFLRIEYRFEKALPEVIKKTIIHENYHHDYWCNCWKCRPHRPWKSDPRITYSAHSSGGLMKSSSQSRSAAQMMADSAELSTLYESAPVKGEVKSSENLRSANFVSVPKDEEGITVKGSQSQQTFMYASIGELEENSTVIIIKMRGTTSVKTPVVKPLTVKENLKCETCGRVNKSSLQYCSNCGTNLR